MCLKLNFHNQILILINHNILDQEYFNNQSFLVIEHLFLILKTFEYKIALLIFKLSDLVVSAHVVVFEACIGRARVLFLPSATATCILVISWVKHVSAQVQHSALVDLTVLGIAV